MVTTMGKMKAFLMEERENTLSQFAEAIINKDQAIAKLRKFGMEEDEIECIIDELITEHEMNHRSRIYTFWTRNKPKNWWGS